MCFVNWVLGFFGLRIVRVFDVPTGAKIDVQQTK